jgi:putative hydroxymethylpyrimidine transport system permease protein
MSARLRYALAPAAVVLAAVGVWELLAQTGVLADVFNISDFLVPAPSEIAESLWEDRSLLAEDAWVTLQEVVLGFALALACGLGFALLIHLSDTARRALYPLLVASQTIPIVVLAPILVVILGFELAPKLAIIALICFFPITVNTLDGLASVDPELRKMMRTLGAGRVQILRRVEVPTALPYLFSGAKVAVAVAVIGAVFAETSASGEGLGHLIEIANSQLLTARAFAAMVVLSAMAIALFALLSLLERRVVHWRPREPRRSR